MHLWTLNLERLWDAMGKIGETTSYEISLTPLKLQESDKGA